MYPIIKTVHSYWSIFVLIMIIVVILNSIRGKVLGKDFEVNDLRLSLFGLIFAHIQLLIGLLLYFISPWFNQWVSIGKEIMKNSDSRLYLVEHPLTNILAILIISMGWSMHKRQTISSKKFYRIALFYGLGLILLLSRIPWNTWL